MSKGNLMGKQEIIKELWRTRAEIIKTIPDGQPASDHHRQAIGILDVIRERIEALKIA